MQDFNRDKIISELWHSPDVAAAIAKTEPADLRDDLRQEMFLALCDMPAAKFKSLYEKNELRWYILGIMRTMIFCERSWFYKTHRKFNEQMLSDTKPETLEHHEPLENVKLIDRVPDALATLDPYEQSMIAIYAELRTCNPIAKATGIPERSVRQVISNARMNLKKELRAYVD